MLSAISKFQKKIWDKWNTRVVILFSLFLQIFLILSAPSRKRTRSFFISFVWLAYLLADWAAAYCIGLISSNQEQKSSLSQNDKLMAFWGPFLLLHLGGPDTISAFAMEDNELWLRHLFGLVAQSSIAIYVFLLNTPHNPLLAPTISMFVAGLLKYAERTFALYVAAVNNFRRSLLPRPDAGPNYAKLMEEHSSREKAGLPAKIIMIPELHQRSSAAGNNNNGEIMAEDKKDLELVQRSENAEHQNKNKASMKKSKEDTMKENNKALELVQAAYFFFEKFQGLIVDMIYSFKDRLDTQKRIEDKTEEEVLRLIEIELNFMFDVFYTKASVVHQYWYWLWGKFISIILITVSLILFIKEERHAGFDKLDVIITYVLLSGALALDVMALARHLFSDYNAILSDEERIDSYLASSFRKLLLRVFKYLNESMLAWFLRQKGPTWSTIKEGPYEGYEKLSTNVLFRRWCESISGYNLVKYCLHDSIPRVPHYLHPNPIVKFIQGLCFKIVVSTQDAFYLRDVHFGFKDFLDQMRYEFENPFLKELWKYVFAQLKEKSCGAHDVETIQGICSARGERVIQKMLESLKENANKVAVQLESLKPYVDPNEVATQIKSLQPCEDPNEIASKSESLKENMNSITSFAAQIERLKPFVDPNEVAFDEALLLWHIATALCHAEDNKEIPGEERRKINTLIEKVKNKSLQLLHMAAPLFYGSKDVIKEGDEGDLTNGERKQDKKDEGMKISMLLSDYMLYLLIMQPNMMSAIAGIGQIRFQDTCGEAKKFFKKRIPPQGDREDMLKKACKRLMEVPIKLNPIDVKGDRSKSLLFDACRLAEALKDLGDKKWEIISSVWVELLSYAACHCRPTGHVQLLSKGGELISFVWLLMVHLGLSTQFQIKDGDARAKLIVGRLANKQTHGK